jgi:hypothetical protein
MFGQGESQTWITGNQLLKLPGDLNRRHRPNDGLDSSLGIQRLGADQIKQEIKGLWPSGSKAASWSSKLRLVGMDGSVTPVWVSPAGRFANIRGFGPAPRGKQRGVLLPSR